MQQSQIVVADSARPSSTPREIHRNNRSTPHLDQRISSHDMTIRVVIGSNRFSFPSCSRPTRCAHLRRQETLQYERALALPSLPFCASQGWDRSTHFLLTQLPITFPRSIVGVKRAPRVSGELNVFFVIPHPIRRPRRRGITTATSRDSKMARHTTITLMRMPYHSMHHSLLICDVR